MEPELYLRVREKEGRLYSDDIVARLPFISGDHPLAGEWRARSASAQRLVGYSSFLKKPRFILDLGCGNGWLSNLLAKAGHRVMGLDQNLYELKQAARVFRSNPNLSFLASDIFSAPFISGLFDVIILASVLQYFSDAASLISVLLSYLRPQGEIHILDTPLYAENELEEAKLRSNQHYTSLGFPEMTAYYFHHRASYLEALQSKTLYAPRPLTLRLKRWIGQVDSPFPWFVIRKQN